MSEALNIVVVGLGYVGLPLAVALGAHGDVVGYDVDRGRIDELLRGHDRTREVEPEALAAARLTLTADPARSERTSISSPSRPRSIPTTSPASPP